MRRRLAALLVVAIALSACAKTPTKEATVPGDALPAVLDAIQKTNDAGSARMAIDLTVTSAAQTVHVTGRVDYVMDPTDPTTLRERVVLDLPSLGMMPGGNVEMIVGKGSVIYVRAPMLAPFIPVATPWIKVDPSSLPGSGEQLGAATAAANPAAILRAIREALTVDEVGPDTVDGSDTTRYQATIDLVKLLPLLASMASADEKPTDAEMQHAKDELEKAGMQTLPFELWVDGNGFLKRMQLAIDMSHVDPDHPGPSFSLTLTLSDIGEDISVDIPPASQVTDISDMLLSGFPSTMSA